eukprot:SAG22_NODE_5335_length_1034_cov_1.272727_2_plen_75_part_00
MISDDIIWFPPGFVNERIMRSNEYHRYVHTFCNSIFLLLPDLCTDKVPEEHVLGVRKLWTVRMDDEEDVLDISV